MKKNIELVARNLKLKYKTNDPFLICQKLNIDVSFTELGNIKGFFKKFGKKEEVDENTKDAAKERLHLVLMQDRANVSADFLEMMKQEIIDVIKKYVDVDEAEIDVRLTNQINDDGTNGAPALYANIPITGIKNEKINTKIKNKSEQTEVKKVINKNVIEENGNDNKKENKVL